MKRLDFDYTKKTETELEINILSDGVHILCFRSNKSGSSLELVDDQRPGVLDQQQWDELHKTLKIISDFHFGRNYLWVEVKG